MSEAKTIRLQLNADLPPMGNKGDVIVVPVSRTGILKVKYWRRRLKDAETDNCVEILKKGDLGSVAKAKAEAEAKAKKEESKAKPGADQGVGTDAK